MLISKLRRRALAAAAVVLAPPLLTAVPAQSTEAGGTTYYVSPAGDDAYDGTSLATPFRTIQRCAMAATAGDTCLLREGTYRETVRPANSGTADAPITFERYGDEVVTVTGADPVTGWTQVSEADVPLTVAGTRFAQAVAEGHVHRAQVEVNPELQGNQVFVNGRMVNQARWPNSGLNPLTPNFATLKTGSTPNSVVDPELDFPAGFWTGATIWVNGGSEWMAHTGTVLESGPGHLVFRSPRTDWQPGGCEKFCAKTGNPYFLTGVLGALDAPGEWHYDELTSTLYLWSPDGDALSSQLVEVKQRPYAFDLAEREYVHVVGLHTFASTITLEDLNTRPGTTPPAVGIVIDGLNARYVSHFVDIPTTPAPIAPQSPFAAHVLDTGIILAGEDNVLRNSVITYSAGNGVSVRGERNVVENNLISETDYGGVMNAPVMAVSIVNVETAYGILDPPDTEVTITRNTLFNTARDGINYIRFPNDGATYNGSGGFPRKVKVSYNDVFNVGLWHQDSGGIYICCEFDLTGGSIDHNWFHEHLSKSDRHNTSGYPGEGIYLDLGERNIRVHHNVSWNNGTSGFHMNPGNQRVNRGLKAYNNTFGDGQEYSFNSLPGLQPETEFINNIFRGPVHVEEGSIWRSNLHADVDPLFVDPAHGDLRLQDGSPAIDAGEVIAGITDGFFGSAPDIGAYESGTEAWTPGCTMAACGYVMVDDVDSTVSLSGGWDSCVTGCDPPVGGRAASRTWGRRAWPYAGTLTSSATPGATATVAFSGTAATVHVKRAQNTGIAAISVDGGPEELIDTYLPVAPCGSVEQVGSSCLPSPPGAGDQLVYAVRDLPAGDHTLTIRVTGTAHPEAQGATIQLDRIMLSDGGSPVAVRQSKTASRSTIDRGGKRKTTVSSSSPVVWDDHVGDASPPLLDLAQGTAECVNGSVVFGFAVPDLDLETADKLSSYYVYRAQWEHDGTTYFADAAFGFTRGNPHRVAFFDGQVLPDGTAVLHHEVEGSFVAGPDGQVTIAVPFQNVGMAEAGALTNVTGRSIDYPLYAYYLGRPTPQGPGLTVDSAGGGKQLTYGSDSCQVEEMSTGTAAAGTPS